MFCGLGLSADSRLTVCSSSAPIFPDFEAGMGIGGKCGGASCKSRWCLGGRGGLLDAAAARKAAAAI